MKRKLPLLCGRFNLSGDIAAYLARRLASRTSISKMFGMRLGAMAIMGHAQFRRVGLSLIDWDMISSNAAVFVYLGDSTGCFFALSDVHQALVILPNDENNEKDVELGLVPFVPRIGTPPFDEDADVMAAKLCLDLFDSSRGTPPFGLFIPSDNGNESDTKLCLALFVSCRSTPPSESSSENHEDGRFFWFPLAEAQLSEAKPADGFKAVACRIVGSAGPRKRTGDDSSDDTLSSDRLLLRRREATCVMRGFPISSYRDGEDCDCLSESPV